MKIETIKETLEASIIVGEELLDAEIDCVYASDLMSDVLAFGKPNSILLTGLATQQAVISAHMAEFKGVVLVRGKRTKDGAERFARDHHLVLLSTHFDMYDACVRIEAIKRGPLSLEPPTVHAPAEPMLLESQFFIEGTDFAKAGMVSTDVKSILKKNWTRSSNRTPGRDLDV